MTIDKDVEVHIREINTFTRKLGYHSYPEKDIEENFI